MGSAHLLYGEGMVVDDRRRLSASQEALSEFRMPDILRLDEDQHDHGEQSDLVFAVLRKLIGEAPSRLGQGSGGRVLF